MGRVSVELVLLVLLGGYSWCRETRGIGVFGYLFLWLSLNRVSPIFGIRVSSFRSSRPLRIQFSGAVYHVINRGTARQATFVQEEDCEAFLKTLAEAHVLWGVEVFA
jgi:hypothetical protein